MCIATRRKEIHGPGLQFEYLNGTDYAQDIFDNITNNLLTNALILGDFKEHGKHEYHCINFGDWELIIEAQTDSQCTEVEIESNCIGV